MEFQFHKVQLKEFTCIDPYGHHVSFQFHKVQLKDNPDVAFLKGEDVSIP